MDYILEAKHITKNFGGIKALDAIDFELGVNEILGLVGDNGAGKSTLIKILAGAILPDIGEIYIDGKEVFIENPTKAKELGIETVYQDLGLIESLNVYENLFLGRPLVRDLKIARILQKRKMEAETKKLIKDLGVRVENVKSKVSQLSGGQRQSIAVVKAGGWGKKIVLMDEPTAALGVKESRNAIKLIKDLKLRGLSIVIITHNLENAFSVADRIFVLRLGRRVGIKKVKDTTIDEVVKMITGGVL